MNKNRFDIRYQSRIRIRRLELQLDNLEAMIEGAQIQRDALAGQLLDEREHFKRLCEELDLPEVIPVKMEFAD